MLSPVLENHDYQFFIMKNINVHLCKLGLSRLLQCYYKRLVSHIADASLSKNHKFPYHKPVDIYNHFRLQFDLPLSWSPPVDYVINFLDSLS